MTVPALVAALPAAALPEQLAIVEAIPRLDSSTARPALLPLLDAADANLRLASARALAASADAGFAKQLLAELSAAAHPDRGATIVALGGSLAHLMRSSTLDAELRTEATDVGALAALSGDPDEAVEHLRALEALRELHDQRAVAFAIAQAFALAFSATARSRRGRARRFSA